MKQFAIVMFALLFMAQLTAVAGCAATMTAPKPLLSFEGADKGPLFYPVIAVKLKNGRVETLLPGKPKASYEECEDAAQAQALVEDMREDVDDVLFSCVGVGFRDEPPIKLLPGQGV